MTDIEICKNFMLGFSLIISTCLLIRLVHVEYVRSKQINDIMPEIRTQFGDMYESIATTEKTIMAQLMTHNRIRILDDGRRREEMWKNILDVIHGMEQNKCAQKNNNENPKTETTSTQTPLLIHNRLIYPESPLTKVLNRK